VLIYTAQLPPCIGEGAGWLSLGILIPFHSPLHKWVRFTDVVPTCPSDSHLRRTIASSYISHQILCYNWHAMFQHLKPSHLIPFFPLRQPWEDRSFGVGKGNLVRNSDKFRLQIKGKIRPPKVPPAPCPLSAVKSNVNLHCPCRQKTTRRRSRPAG
jgi:hypothetical protein